MINQILRKGCKSDKVKVLQEKLVKLGYNLKPDGHFGVNTEREVKKFQKDNGLLADGVAGLKTLALINTEQTIEYLVHIDYQKFAERLGVPVAAIRAVDEVESNGDGFLSDGRIKILFERHWMLRLLIEKGEYRKQYEQWLPGIVSKQTGGYSSGDLEHERLRIASCINTHAAHESCSWGAFQIMGFHWERLGFINVFEFIDFIKQGEENQLDVFCKFIETDKRLLSALREQNWVRFASIYNGPNYAKNAYDSKLANAFKKFS